MAVLDTNFLIALHDREGPALRLLDELRGEVLLVPSVVAVEFLTAYGRRAPEAYAELERAFTVAHTDGDWVREAARLRARLRREGRSIRLADFWIATWAHLHGTFVVTRNERDFEALGVRARRW